MDDEMKVVLSDSSLALLQQLQRKDLMFAKLSGFLQDIQETGTSVDEWQDKLDELDMCRKENAELQSKMQGLGQSNNQLQSANAELKASVDDLQNDMVQLNNAVLQEQAEADKLRTYLDNVEVDGKGKEGKYQDMIEGLHKEIDATKEELLKSSQTLEIARSTNQELNNELTNEKRKNQTEREGTIKLVQELRGQIGRLEQEKKDMNRHFWNLTEQSKDMKQRMEKGEEEAEGLQFELAAAKKELEGRTSANKEREEGLLKELAAGREKIDKLSQQVSELQDKKTLGDASYQSKLEQKIAEADRLREQLQQQGMSAQRAVQDATLENRRLQSEVEAAAVLSAQLKESAQSQQQRLKQADRRVLELQEMVGQKSQELGLAQGQVETMRSGQTHLHQKLEQLMLADETQQQLLGTVARAFECSLDAVGGVAEAKAKDLDRLSKKETALLAETREAREKLAQVIVREDVLTARAQAAEDQRDELQEQVRQTGERAADAESKLEALQDMHEAAVGEQAEEIAKAQKAHSVVSHKMKKEVDSIHHRVRTLEGEKLELLQEADSLNKSLEAEQGRCRDLTEQLRVMAEQQAPMEHKVEQAQAQVQALESELEEAKADVGKQRQTVVDVSTSLRETIERLERELAAAKDGSAGAVDDLQLENDKLEEELEQLHEAYDKADAELSKKSAKLKEAADLISELRTRMETATARASDDSDRFLRDLEIWRHKAEQAGEEAERLAAALQSAQQAGEKAQRDAAGFRDQKRSLSDRVRALEAERNGVVDEQAKLRAEAKRAGNRVRVLEAELEAARQDAKDAQASYYEAKKGAAGSDGVSGGTAGAGAGAASNEVLQQLNEKCHTLEEERRKAAAELKEAKAQLSTVQSAANATIDNLMGELKSAEVQLTQERERRVKEKEALEEQTAELDEEMARREAKAKLSIKKLRDEAENAREQQVLLQSQLVAAQQQVESKFRGDGQALQRARDEVVELQRALADAEGRAVAAARALEEAKRGAEQASHAAEEERAQQAAQLAEMRERHAEAVREVQRMRAEGVGGAEGEEQLELLREQTETARRELQRLEEERTLEAERQSARQEELEQELLSVQEAANATIGQLRGSMSKQQSQHQAQVMALQRELESAKSALQRAEEERVELVRSARIAQGAEEDLTWQKPSTGRRFGDSHSHRSGGVGSGRQQSGRQQSGRHHGSGGGTSVVEEQPVAEQPVAAAHESVTRESRLVVDETGELVDPYDPGYMGTSSQAQAHIAAAAQRLDDMSTRQQQQQQQQQRRRLQPEALRQAPGNDAHPLGRALGNGGHRQSAEELRALMMQEEAEAEARTADRKTGLWGEEAGEEDPAEEKENMRPEEESQGHDYDLGLDGGADLDDGAAEAAMGVGAEEGLSAHMQAQAQDAGDGDDRLQVERDMDRFFGIASSSGAGKSGKAVGGAAVAGKKQGSVERKSGTAKGKSVKGKQKSKAIGSAGGRKGKGAVQR